MPFIRIKSLPLEASTSPADLVVGISADFAQKLAVDEKHISVTWEIFQSDHYASAGGLAKTQPLDHHPLLVEILAPDFNEKGTIKKMLEVTAESISRHSGIPESNIFINFTPARSGMVFDDGQLVHW